MPEVCVGQQVAFNAYWWGGNPYTPHYTNADIRWHLPDKYVNHTNQTVKFERIDPTDPDSPAVAILGSINYDIFDDYLTNSSTQCWYVNQPGGTCSVREILTFANGQSVTAMAKGDFTVFRPSISITNQAEILHSFFLTRAGIAGIYACVATGQEVTPTNPILHGMSYWVVYTNIGKYSGEGMVTQLLTADCSGADAPNFSDWRLDGNTEAYSTPVFQDASLKPIKRESFKFSDSPKNAHFRNIFHPVIRCKYTFEDYCRFKPSGDGIYVTLGIVHWDCDGESPSDGVLSPNLINGPDDPDGSDAFPSWSQNYPEGSNKQ